MALTKFLRILGKDEAGATAVEYGLIVSLVVIAATGAFSAVADENTGMWARVQSDVTAVLGD